MPVPPGGAMIKRHWIHRYSKLPPEQELLIVLQSRDTASKGGPENDLLVCTTWVVTHNRRWYLIDVCRKRVDYPELNSGSVQTPVRANPRRQVQSQTSPGRGHRGRDRTCSRAAGRQSSGNRRGEAGARQR